MSWRHVFNDDSLRLSLCGSRGGEAENHEDDRKGKAYSVHLSSLLIVRDE
jgi:hypothetical protein